MRVVIPSRGRWYAQPTLYSIPEEVAVDLVVRSDEAEQYNKFHGHRARIITHPESAECIRDVREWILQTYEEAIVEMDDDLTFAKRREDDMEKFRPATAKELQDLIYDYIPSLLQNYPLVGISAREGANRNFDDVLYATRQLRLHAYDPGTLRALGVTWKLLQAKVMEDFALILQLLTMGYANAVINSFVTNQAGSNTKGGCSTYRSLDVQREAALELAEKYPQFVTVVEKHTKTSWGGQPRTDVRIQWKRAYLSSSTS